MKTCEICKTKKIKNGYRMCYECNQKDDTTCSDQEVEVSRTIPKCVRNALWINFFKTDREGKCKCCLRETISIGNFHCGHIKAVAHGGKTTLDNMIPICMLCNTSMGKADLNEFISRYNLHYGL